MKIEPVRGWAQFFEMFSTLKVETDPEAMSPKQMREDTPVLVIPVTPENIEAMREKIACVYTECLDKQQSTLDDAREVLTALGITKE